MQELILVFFNVDPSNPKIDIEVVNLQPNQGKNFSLRYNVLSYPASHIKWWRSKDGIHYELIAHCPPSQMCVKQTSMMKVRKENISKTSFEIRDLKFPDDEFFYKCNASNTYGNDSKIFRLEVYGNLLPRLFCNIKQHILEKFLHHFFF